MLLLQGTGLSELPGHGAVLARGQPVEAEEDRGREAGVEEAEAAGPGQHGPREEADERTEDNSNNIQWEGADPEKTRAQQTTMSSKRNDKIWNENIVFRS